MPGDIVHIQSQNTKKVADVVLDGTAVAATAAITVKSANHQIFIQKITLSITSHIAAKVFRIEDSAGTPVVIAARTDLAAAAGVPDEITWDFGPNGFPATKGTNVNYVANTGGSGFSGVFHIEAYEKLIGPVSINVAG